MNLTKYVSKTILLIWLPITLVSQDFSWEKGSKISGSSGTPGTQGVASPANNPGARNRAGHWKDLEGNFWIFGGDITQFSSSHSFKNELFKYDVTSKEWTWMKGFFYNTNDAGIYGSQGMPNINNRPGARRGSATWTDLAGNLWLFGGLGYGTSIGNYSFLNDLWKYDPSTNMWTWVRGTNGLDQAGTYGTKGIFASSNMPGARTEASTWVDKKGNLWLFGGDGRDANGTYCRLNDLWCYDIALNQWVWISGGKTNTYFGKYGTLGVPSTTNFPGGRYACGSWADTTSNLLYLFGGYGFGDNYDIGGKFLNDIWKFNITDTTWTWIKGSTTSSQPCSYGALGYPSTGSSPGGRFGFAHAADPAGNFWVFGGIEDGQGSANIQMHDLWKYDPITNRWAWFGGNNVGSPYGVYGIQGTPDPANIPGVRHYSNGWCDVAGNFYVFGGDGKGESTYGFLNDLWKYGNCVSGGFPISSSDSVLCAGQTTSLSVNSGTYSVLWNNNEFTSVINVSPLETTSYTVVIYNVHGCNIASEYTQKVVDCTGLTESTQTAPIAVYPNPNNGYFKIRSESTEFPLLLKIYNGLSQTLVETQIYSDETLVDINLPEGIYFYEIKSDNKIVSFQKLIIRR